MKKKIFYMIIVVAGIAAAVSCKKNQDSPIASSSLTIVNAMSGGPNLLVNFSGNSNFGYYRTAVPINANSYTEYGGHIGNVTLSLVPSTDTLHTLYNHPINMAANEIATLFVMGTTTSVDTLLTVDHVPGFAAADSLMGVRFINISKGSNPLTVNIKGQTAFINSLPYKTTSAFQSYSIKNAVTNYIFEIRDPAVNRLVATYTLGTTSTAASAKGALKIYQNKSITIALKGIQGGVGANTQGTLIINNY